MIFFNSRERNFLLIKFLIIYPILFLAPPRECCPNLIITNADACNGIYNKTQSMLNDRVVYKQDGGDNWLFYDTSHFCIGENPDLPCEEQGILAENVPDQ